MCAITGIFDTRGQRPVDELLLRRMNDAQWHRGPDDCGVHVESGVGLAHRRLSIIDLAGGRQPLYNEDGSVVVVYNGEIYNFRALEQELLAAGHVFRTRCDTEVIVHAWEEWGEACVERFRGMFAFAVWDRNRHALFLARDRVGIKPLHYALLPDGHLIFASELKALQVYPGLSKELDASAVEDYMALGYVPDPKTIFLAARKLEPGHSWTFFRGESSKPPRRYWDVSFVSNGTGGLDQVRETLIEQLTEAVHLRLIADVPLGAFLSGGVDSSAVVAMMARSCEEPVNTCAISFGDPSYDEVRYAGQVAARYGTRHRVEEVDAEDLALVNRLAEVYDEPYADSSAIPTYRVCQLARKHVKVALSGDGGDESFAGYRRYRWHMYEEQVRSRLPAGLRRRVFGLAGTMYPKLDRAPRALRAKSTLQALARDSTDAYFQNFSLLPDELRFRLYRPEFKRQLGGYRALEVFERHLGRAPEHPLSRAQYLDFKTYLPGDILTKVDRASMAHALEVRVPILDHVFLDWVCGLPAGLKLNRGRGKYCFKKALEPYLPDDILYRPKMGFAVPIGSWFRGSLRERLRRDLLEGDLRETGIFDNNSIRKLVDQHQSGRRDHTAGLWALLMFEAFVKRQLSAGTGQHSEERLAVSG